MADSYIRGKHDYNQWLRPFRSLVIKNLSSVTNDHCCNEYLVFTSLQIMSLKTLKLFDMKLKASVPDSSKPLITSPRNVNIAYIQGTVQR